MYDALSALLGIDLDDLDWKDLALCDGMETNLFYDAYETDDNVANMIDEACLSCPVMAQCLQRGIDNNEWGVWGGVYLVNGNVDENRNSHKTKETWSRIKEKVNENSV